MQTKRTKLIRGNAKQRRGEKPKTTDGRAGLGEKTTTGGKKTRSAQAGLEFVIHPAGQGGKDTRAGDVLTTPNTSRLKTAPPRTKRGENQE